MVARYAAAGLDFRSYKTWNERSPDAPAGSRRIPPVPEVDGRAAPPADGPSRPDLPR